MKNKSIYMYFLLFRVFFAFGTVFFTVLAIAFFDVEMLVFFALMIGVNGLFTFLMWYPGVFVDYKKNLFTVRTTEGLGTLKIPLDEVKSVTAERKGLGRMESVEFRVVQKNGYIHRRELFCRMGDFDSIKKRVEELFPKESVE